MGSRVPGRIQSLRIEDSKSRTFTLARASIVGKDGASRIFCRYTVHSLC